MKCKTALIAGTKENSIGRAIATRLHAEGWNVWLYSRNAKPNDSLRWQERRCDLLVEEDVRSLLAEIPALNFVLFSADSGTGYGNLEDLELNNTKQFLDSKLVTSVMLTAALLKQNYADKVKLAWCAGKLASKPEHLLLYGIANNAIANIVEQVNEHHSEKLEAYYLPTPLTSPSPLGDLYLSLEPDYKKFAQPPSVVIEQVMKIVNGSVKPGIIDSKAELI